MILLVLLCFSAITWAIQHRYFKLRQKLPSHPVAAKFAAPVYDKVLFSKFEQICKKYDTLKKNYTIKGFVTMIDKADSSTHQMKNVNFILCKKGDALYYKLGATETINEDGVYLYIDHAGKRILAAQQKQINNAAGMQDLAQIATTLKSEYYNMSGSENNGIQTISFTNEHHITCKQYTISYDTLSHEIKHIYTRLTNFRDPLNKSKDKIIEMYISEWDNKALINDYVLPRQIVRTEGTGWKKTKAYENYELIDM